MEIVNGRELKQGQKVKVYVNLNKKGFYSIQDSASGLVVGYAETVLLSDCKTHVSQTGRAKTIKEQRKRVHAWVTGYFEGADLEQPADTVTEVNYNPYIHEHFTNVTNNEKVETMPKAYFKGKRVYI